MTKVHMMAAGSTEGPGPEKPVGDWWKGGYCGPETHLHGSTAIVSDAKGYGTDKVCAQFDHQQMDSRALHAGWWLFDATDFRKLR